MNKQEIRKLYLEKRKSENPIACGIKASEKIFTLEKFKNAEVIMVYMSAKGEIDTSYLIKHSFELSKKVCVPIVRGNDMYAAFITPETPLIKGSFGISEPEKVELCSPEDIDLIITPGVAFSKNGFRVGYGKGYYDRFFKSTNAHRIGFCFDICVCDVISPEAHDIAVNKVVTECDIYE